AAAVSTVAYDRDDHVAALAAGAIGPIEMAAPVARPQRFMAAADETRLGEYGADREFGHRTGVATGRIDDQHVAIACGLHIDIDRPAARDRDEFELRQPLQHRPRVRRQM